MCAFLQEITALLALRGKPFSPGGNFKEKVWKPHVHIFIISLVSAASSKRISYNDWWWKGFCPVDSISPQPLSSSCLFSLVSFLVSGWFIWGGCARHHGQICLCKVSVLDVWEGKWQHCTCSVGMTLTCCTCCCPSFFVPCYLPCAIVAVMKLQFMFHYPCRSAFELWGHGQTHSELRTSLLNYPSENMVCNFTANCSGQTTLCNFRKTLI